MGAFFGLTMANIGESIKDSWGYEIEFYCSHVTAEQIARAIKRELRVD